ncbi:hypothetical protein QP027_02620 [Corynebacterium breve]|uniref:Uncharacterized protein n=1 Tax=Corynebacterium breve TaxID=3049799 RepID=A0ABY8VJB3_9CORY|nr:hypothetical protein [Corynebacterium breve]WIM68313.1 hypothetical protein QP027_02620 [Corynebacterium breve]
MANNSSKVQLFWPYTFLLTAAPVMPRWAASSLRVVRERNMSSLTFAPTASLAVIN